MNTYIAYFDESGDDGANVESSKEFVLTSAYMDANIWQDNYNRIRAGRRLLKDKYGFHVSEEIHTKHLVRDKGLYRVYNWTDEQRKEIIKDITKLICKLDIKFTNIIIDKTKIISSEYKVLEKALTYNVQRIENTSHGEWNYLIITDEGRLPPMRKTARAIRAYNPVQSHFGGIQNIPIKGLIEDVLAKESDESYFIQLCDFVSFFADMYFRCEDKGEALPKRVERVVDSSFIRRVFVTLREADVLNIKASNSHKFGFVIYPK